MTAGGGGGARRTQGKENRRTTWFAGGARKPFVPLAPLEGGFDSVLEEAEDPFLADLASKRKRAAPVLEEVSEDPKVGSLAPPSPPTRPERCA